MILRKHISAKRRVMPLLFFILEKLGGGETPKCPVIRDWLHKRWCIKNGVHVLKMRSYKEYNGMERSDKMIIFKKQLQTIVRSSSTFILF